MSRGLYVFMAIIIATLISGCGSKEARQVNKLLEAGEYKAAEELATQYLQNKPTAELYLLKARALWQQGEKDEALKIVLQASNLKDAHFGVFELAVAEYAKRTGQLLSAGIIYEKLAGENLRKEYKAQVYLGLGECLEATGRKADAIEAYKNYLKLAPKSPEACRITYKVGKLYEEVLANYKEATDWYRDVMDKYPNSYEAALAKGASELMKYNHPEYFRAQVEVKAWAVKRINSTEVLVSAIVVNKGNVRAGVPEVVAEFFDEAGKRIAEGRVKIEKAFLDPGESRTVNIKVPIEEDFHKCVVCAKWENWNF